MPLKDQSDRYLRALLSHRSCRMRLKDQSDRYLRADLSRP
jgi:hypothetical protein